MSNLRKEIEQAINKYSAENNSNTPDFILAEFIMDSLAAFDKATNARVDWHKIENIEKLPSANIQMIGIGQTNEEYEKAIKEAGWLMPTKSEGLIVRNSMKGFNIPEDIKD